MGFFLVVCEIEWKIVFPCRLFGSAFPRVMPFSILSTCLTALLFYYPGHEYFYRVWGQEGHPFVYNNLGFIIGFILVFRSNFAYARFVAGRNQLQTMSAHWANACSTALAFEAADTAHRLGRHEGNHEAHVDSDGFDGASPRLHHIDPKKFTLAIRRYEAFKNLLLHKFSLLHALCLQHLRVDWMLSNLHPHTPGDDPPPEDAAALGDLTRSLRDYLMLPASANQSLVYNAIATLPVIPGVSKEDTGAGNSIKGGCVTQEELVTLGYKFEAIAEKQYETTFTGVDRSVRGVGSLERRKSLDLEAISSVKKDMDGITSENGEEIRSVTSIQSEEEPKSPRAYNKITSLLQQQTGLYVIGAQERVYTAFSWVQTLIAQRSDQTYGWKAVAPPTGVTIWRSLSDGFAAFEQCRALVDTPFPFPWAQVMVVLLLIYSCTVPLLMCTWTGTLWLALLLSFLSGEFGKYQSISKRKRKCALGM